MAGPERMTTEEVVRKVLLDEHADVVREALKLLVGELMEPEVSELVGAELGERRPDDRVTHRNGYRARCWDTRAGENRVADTEAQRGQLLPVVSAAAQVLRAGARRGRPQQA